MDERLRELTQLFLIQRDDPSIFIRYITLLIRSSAPISLVHQVANDWIREFGWESFDWQFRINFKEMLKNYGIVLGIFFKFKLREWTSTELSSVVDVFINFLKRNNDYSIEYLPGTTDRLDNERITEAGSYSPSQVARNLEDAQNSMRLTDQKMIILRKQMMDLSTNLGNDNFRIFIPTWILDDTYAPVVTVTNQGWSRSNIWRTAESKIQWSTYNQVLKLRVLLFRELKNSLHINSTQFTINFLLK